jgi:hypothetical protein
MQGSERCEEIIRLIDEALASQPIRPVPRSLAASPPLESRRLPDRRKQEPRSAERQRLLDVVGEFLTLTVPEVLPA